MRILACFCMLAVLASCTSPDNTRVTREQGRDVDQFINAPVSKSAKPL